MTRSAIIVAGGSGTRMGTSTPKQFLVVSGMPLLGHTLNAFQRADPDMRLILVLPKKHIDTWRSLVAVHGINIPHEVVSGGVKRSDSVRAGLHMVTDSELVAVHDGVRSMVSSELVNLCFTEAQRTGTAVPVIPITSSVRRLTPAGNSAIDRSDLRAVQTPQCFKTQLLRDAFAANPDLDATDEATLVENNGHPINLVQGEVSNIKVTTPFDIKLARILLSN